MKLGPGKGRIVFDGCLSFSFGITENSKVK